MHHYTKLLKSFEVSIKYVSCHLQNMTEWLLCRCNAGDFYEYFMLNMFILFLITIIAATMLLCYQLFSFLQWIWIYINMLKFRTIFIFMWYCNYLLYVSRGENSNIASSPQRYHVLSLKTRSDTLWREIGQWDWGIWGRGLDFIQVSLKTETVAGNPRRIDFKSVEKSFRREEFVVVILFVNLFTPMKCIYSYIIFPVRAIPIWLSNIILLKFHFLRSVRNGTEGEEQTRMELSLDLPVLPVWDWARGGECWHLLKRTG